MAGEKPQPIILSFAEYARPIYEGWDKEQWHHERLKRDTGCDSWVEYLGSGLWRDPSKLGRK